MAAAIHWYHQGLISGSKAGEIAGVTRLEFLDELARRKLDVFLVDMDQLQEEVDRA
jgi:predicted HTH domain antitoxin